MPDASGPRAARPSESGPPSGHFARADSGVLRLLSHVEHAILSVVCVALLAIAVIIMVQLGFTIVRVAGSWPHIIIVSIEELLLILIVLEVFVMVLTHLQGGHLLLEPLSSV